MINIPLNAEIICNDGAAGKSTSVVVNPVTRKVTHFVAMDSRGIERLVPIGQVEDTSANSITLSCSLAELEAMENFIEERYITSDRYSNVGVHGAQFSPYVVQKTQQTTIKVEEEQLPEGTTSIHRGTVVEASDGEVGRVDELLIDTDTDVISHMVLSTGQPLGKKEIAIPVSAIQSVVGDVVYLKLDKQGISSLPAIHVHRPWEEITVSDVELIVSTFTDAEYAGMALAKLQKMERFGELDVLNAAVITKDAEGEASFKETGDVDSRRGALFGALTGGLFGLIGGPVGAVVGAVAGATTGHVAAGRLDMGFPDEYLQSIQESLERDSSALVVLVEQPWVDAVIKVIANFDGKQVRQTLPDEKVAELLKAIEGTDGDS
jgi:uncharacterized membrane protein